MRNLDEKTVVGFGHEWERFDQTQLTDREWRDTFDQYFAIFPWEEIDQESEGFDLGCGSGRWAKLVAPRVGKIHCIDPSAALGVARRNLRDQENCQFHAAGVADMDLADESMDFGYSLGVLHHMPDPESGMRACVAKLKRGAPLLVYLYYSLDNRPFWFRAVWRVSNLARGGISRLPPRAKQVASDVIAGVVYWPLARLSFLMETAQIPGYKLVPLSAYRRRSFYAMRTDALDRFGTRLEHRFSREEIRAMMSRCGLERIEFSSDEEGPYWCAVGRRQMDTGNTR